MASTPPEEPEPELFLEEPEPGQTNPINFFWEPELFFFLLCQLRLLALQNSSRSPACSAQALLLADAFGAAP